MTSLKALATLFASMAISSSHQTTPTNKLNTIKKKYQGQCYSFNSDEELTALFSKEV